MKAREGEEDTGGVNKLDTSSNTFSLSLPLHIDCIGASNYRKQSNKGRALSGLMTQKVKCPVTSRWHVIRTLSNMYFHMRHTCFRTENAALSSIVPTVSIF